MHLILTESYNVRIFLFPNAQLSERHAPRDTAHRSVVGEGIYVTEVIETSKSPNCFRDSGDVEKSLMIGHLRPGTHIAVPKCHSVLRSKKCGPWSDVNDYSVIGKLRPFFGNVLVLA